LRPVGAGVVVVVDVGRNRGRQRGQTGVVRRVVGDAGGALVLGATGLGVEVVPVVGGVVPGAERPAVEAGGVHDVPLDRIRRAAVRVGATGVRPVVGDQQVVSHRVNVDLERVPEAHAEDFRPGLVGADREQVAVRYGVGAVRFRVNPQHLAGQRVRVARGA